MKIKTNFERYLEDQLKDKAFADRFRKAGEEWDKILKVPPDKNFRKTRICLWLESQEYLVILARRKGYVLLWTAYPVTENHRKSKLQKEYEAYKMANAAP